MFGLKEFFLCLLLACLIPPLAPLFLFLAVVIALTTVEVFLTIVVTAIIIALLVKWFE